MRLSVGGFLAHRNPLSHGSLSFLVLRLLAGSQTRLQGFTGSLKFFQQASMDLTFAGVFCNRIPKVILSLPLYYLGHPKETQHMSRWLVKEVIFGL
ncbi:MAG: hypothetical protein F4Y87_00045 [Synechococcus sp. SB0665_bin_28]|nr:hypothetical protein [Synechococcus sp. SB0665_bin_28]